MLSRDSCSDAPSQWHNIPDIAIYPPDPKEDEEESTLPTKRELLDENDSKQGNLSTSELCVSEPEYSQAILSDLSVVVRTEEVEKSKQLEVIALKGVATASQALMEATYLALSSNQWVGSFSSLITPDCLLVMTVGDSYESSFGCC